ncbi:MAG: hypothetical protein HW417_1471 [Steroidobacteraceae bacterium]|nr:hypothetical protein [Steroidobacteraceae bacterium]
MPAGCTARLPGSPDMIDRGPYSPCLNICSLDERGVCRGCFRIITEIAGWTRMNPGEQWAVIQRAEERRNAVASDRSK